MRSSLQPYHGLRAMRTALRSIPERPAAICQIPQTATTTPFPRTLYQKEHTKLIHTTPNLPKQKNNAPPSPPPTNFSDLDVLGGTPIPSTSVDVCMYDGFGLNSGITIDGGNGALLVNGEAFAWRPWKVSGKFELVNKKGQFELPEEALGLFDILWPRPDLLVIGVGKSNLPLSPKTKQAISALGMRVEVLDTRNAAAQFNLLATERGVSEVAALLIPIGWKEGSGVVL